MPPPRASLSEETRSSFEPSPAPKRSRAEHTDAEDANSTVVVSDDDAEDNDYFILNGHYYCRECFEANGTAKIGVGKSGGRGGSGLMGRYSLRTGRELRTRHTQSHKNARCTNSTTTAAEHLFGIAPKAEVWVWAMIDGAHTYSAFTRPSFVAAIETLLPNGQFDPPSYRTLRAGVHDLATHLRSIVKQKYGHQPAVLALDGGTLHRCSLLNFAVQPCGDRSCKPIFVCTRQVKDGTAATIASVLKEVRKHVLEAFELTCVAVVSDNASAMARGIADERSDDDENEEQAEDDFFETDASKQDDVLADDCDQPFSVHIRCWAHVMQLLIGDIAKKLPEGVAALKRLTSLPRSVRAEIRLSCVRAGKTARRIIMPAVTRWNSATRAANRIIDIAPEIEQSGIAIEGNEILNLRMFIVLTAPFCWATTRLQSDDANLQVARKQCATIREHLEHIRNQAQEFPANVQRKVLELTGYALERLTVREATYLTNIITEALDSLHATTSLTREKAEDLQRTVERYFRTLGTTVQTLSEETSEFAFRNDNERMRSADDAYWNEVKSRFPTLFRFRREMMRLICTEASVERSFQKQGDLWSRKRNRLAESTIQDELFIAMNYKQLRLKKQDEPEEKREHKEDVSNEAWRRHIEMLQSEETRPARILRPRQNYSALVKGKRIEIRTKARNSQWSKGTVVGVIDAERKEYKVCWDCTLEITTFRPAAEAEEVEWRFTE